MPDYLKRLAMNYAWAENRIRRNIHTPGSDHEQYRLLNEICNLRLHVWAAGFVSEYNEVIPSGIIDEIIEISKNK